MSISNTFTVIAVGGGVVVVGGGSGGGGDGGGVVDTMITLPDLFFDSKVVAAADEGRNKGRANSGADCPESKRINR